jgi:hypothetical protein
MIEQEIFISDAGPAVISVTPSGDPPPPSPRPAGPIQESPDGAGVSWRRTNATFTSIRSPEDVMTSTSLCGKPEDLPRLVLHTHFHKQQPINQFVCRVAQPGLGILS